MSERECPGCGQDGTGLESHDFDCCHNPNQVRIEASDGRAEFAENRIHGLKARHETRVERAIREDPIKALRYLLAQYDRIVEVHEQVVMDTPEDRDLHDRAIATFKEAAEPIRKLLASESGHLTVDVIGPAFPCPPGCAHWSHEEGADL